MKVPLSICVYLLLTTVTASAKSLPCSAIKSDSDAWVTARVNALVRTARAVYETEDNLPPYYRVLDGITRTLGRCKLAADVDFTNRHREFVDYISTIALDRKPDHQLGFNVTDEQYFEETRPFVGIPDYLLQPDFVRWVSRFGTLEKAKSYLRSLNTTRSPGDQLVFFSYASRHLGTPDNDDSYRRLLIVVPGNAAQGVPDKWVQFGVSDPGQRFRTRNVSVVAAKTNSDGTFDAYFKDYFRIYHRDGSISLKGRWELGEGDDNCASCHKSGVLPIFPVAGSVTPDEQEAVEIVNARFRTYGSPRFGKYLDEKKLGPGLSAAAFADRSHRFGKNFENSKVFRAMSCQSCHNPQRLGSLNWPMDVMILSSFVEGGQMPFGTSLKDVERRELYQRLIEEYFAVDDTNPGILQSWLLGRRRSDADSTIIGSTSFPATH